jgi:glycosyltransferase involved in cell wall biosynthesis
MKRTLETVRAFAYVKKEIPNAQLVIAGDMSGVYGEQVAREVAASLFVNDIAILGRISKEKKVEVLQRSHIITVTSVKEGWGLVVTEANSQGTPAVVYNVDGLRDSVRDGVTGSVTIQNKPELLAQAIVILLKDKDKYEQRRSAAHAWSKEITFDRSYTDFKKILAQNI